MIELQSDSIIFNFPEIRARMLARAHAWIDAHVALATIEEKSRLPDSRETLYSEFERFIPEIRASISLQRTLRIPDDGNDYPLPPGLGRFPLHHVDDFPHAPEAWKKRGGVMVPMHKAEALWLHFSTDYPMALKVGAGGICAISGEQWSTSLHTSPQNYAVLPEQPWLDGFRIGEGVIRQFVAAPLGTGLTVEQQIKGEETWGGLQLQAFPLAVEKYDFSLMDAFFLATWEKLIRPPIREHLSSFSRVARASPMAMAPMTGAGLGAGGRIRQKIAADSRGPRSWDSATTSRCFVHLCLAEDWKRLTGTQPPQKPPTAADYTKAGLPWFDFDSWELSVAGDSKLSVVKSVGNLLEEKIGSDLPDNETLSPSNVVQVRPRPSGIVREF